MSDFWFCLRPVGINLNSGLWISGSSPELFSNDDNGDGGTRNLSVLPPFVSHSIWQKTERLKENKLFASAVKLLPPSIRPSVPLSIRPSALCLCVRVLVCVAPLEASRGRC